MNTTSKQVGGNHYKNLAYQPVELFAKTQCNAFQSNIVKYIVRHRYKNGKEDIEKCKHYAELAFLYFIGAPIAYERDVWTTFCNEIRAFCIVNKLPDDERCIVEWAMQSEYNKVIEHCNKMLSSL